MNDWKRVITLATCCGICLAMVPSASADFVGVTTVIKDDPDTEFLCTQGNGDFVPGPLTVCNVFAIFSDPADRLFSVGTTDLQVFDGANPDVLYHHPFNFSPTAPSCLAIPAFPDLICDTYVTIGLECSPSEPPWDGTGPDGDFDNDEFRFNGHIVGGWFNADPDNGQGDAGDDPNLQVLFLQSSVAQGLSLSGDILHVVWEDGDTGEFIVEFEVPIECAASCGSCATDSDGDGDTDAMDLAVLLGSWGPVDAGNCQDADANGVIDAFDLAVLLGAWGPCL